MTAVTELSVQGARLQLARALLVAVVLASVCCATQASAHVDAARPQAIPVSIRPMRQPLGDYFGIGTYIAQRFPELVVPAVQRARITGSDWVREEFTATHLHQRPRGRYHFARYDDVVNRERAGGLHVLGLLDYSNSFTRRGATWMPHIGIRAHTRDFVRYVAAVVSHYRSRIFFWQVWNEPDIHDFWLPHPLARDYAYLLTQSYLAIKRANPRARVVIAGPSGRDRRGVDFLHRVAGFGGRFDILAIQPYVDTPSGSLLTEFNQLRSFHKPIWFTEIGWAGQAGCPSCGQSIYQSRRLATIFLISGLAGVHRVFWYDLRDDGIRPIFPDHFGLLEWDFAGKEAFQAFETAQYFLNNAVIRGVAHLTSNLTLYELEKHKRWYYVAWNDSPSRVTAPLLWNRHAVREFNFLGGPTGASAGSRLTLHMDADSVAYLAGAAVRPPTHLPPGLPLFPGHTR